MDEHDDPPSPRSPVGQAQITVRAEALLAAWREGDLEQRLARVERLLAYDIAKRELIAEGMKHLSPRADGVDERAKRRPGRHDRPAEDS